MIRIASFFSPQYRCKNLITLSYRNFTSFSEKKLNKIKGQLHEIMVKNDKQKPNKPSNLPDEYLQMRWKLEQINRGQVKVVFTKNVMTLYKRLAPQIQQKQGHLLNVIFDHKCEQNCEENPSPKTFPKLLLNKGGVVIFKCEKCNKNQVLFDTYNWVLDEQGYYRKDMDNQIIGLMANIK